MRTELRSDQIMCFQVHHNKMEEFRRVSIWRGFFALQSWAINLEAIKTSSIANTEALAYRSKIFGWSDENVVFSVKQPLIKTLFNIENLLA